MKCRKHHEINRREVEIFTFLVILMYYDLEG